MAKVGISDVAARAGVSEATVSRVINRRGVVATATRRQVEEAIRELGYDRGGQSQLVVVLTPGLAQPFFGHLCELIESALASQGFRAIVASTTVGGLQEIDFISSTMDLGIAGAVFASASNTLIGADPTVYQLLAERKIPFVLVNGAIEGHPSPSFSTNDAVAAELAVDHLWGLGHRDIGLIVGPVGNRPSERRLAGFVQSMTARGVADPQRLAVRQVYSVEGGMSAGETLLDLGVTAIVAASDYMALGAIRAARRRGMSIPEDLSVVGYDDSQVMDFVDPPLTTVRQPVERLAQSVSTAMVHLVNRKLVPSGELLFDPQLIVRGSTAPPRS
ncbi:MULTISPECIES: LacI family DNA-binding transcriptional regulator [Streptomyces]|uniref:LacI family DNA-binding transcriptional regulator n=1 Tax=Streptomyces flaveolus TaxID=67297 RepID=A0ABV3AIM9_9ACTN|nr:MULTISPECIES: LacI family DNA-binding transcriptional regulator [Streptomyces]KMS87282.1 MalR repressor protein [Streptomyces regensis]KOG74832.1 MalR repressor protein [Streptomyces antibioticus]KOV76479.1 MalR repressor protein [Streptomyces sp. NRRL WC-3723]